MQVSLIAFIQNACCKTNEVFRKRKESYRVVMAQKPSIFNYKQIDSAFAIGGQPTTEEQIRELSAFGFETVVQINVQEADFSLKNEQSYAEQYGLKHISLEMSYVTPKIEDVSKFFTLLDTSTSEKTYIHCAAGYCTSALFVMYKMARTNISLEEAMQTFAVPDWKPSDNWLKLIDDVINQSL